MIQAYLLLNLRHLSTFLYQIDFQIKNAPGFRVLSILDYKVVESVHIPVYKKAVNCLIDEEKKQLTLLQLFHNFSIEQVEL